MPNRYMLATVAMCRLHGDDISRDEFDLCSVWGETKHFYIGLWVTDRNFKEVWFPKSTTRELTPEEVSKYEKLIVGIPEQPSFPMV